MNEFHPTQRFQKHWWLDLPWGSIFVGATLVVLFIGLFWGNLTEPWGPRRRSRCKGNLKNIMLALHNYHDVYHSFPPAYIEDRAGKPIHSWRVLLLPFLDQKPLFDRYRFDEPWDGPNNRKLHAEIVGVYRCPNEKAEHETDTSYVVVVGPRTMFPGSRSVKLSDVEDGTSNVLAVVEYRNSGIHWMEPRDLEFSKLPMKINAGYAPGIASRHPGGANAGLADGSVRFLFDEMSEATLRKILQIDDGTPKDDDW